MASVARLLVLGLPALFAVSRARPVTAQQLALAERGPRFLMAPAKAGGAPVEVEAATNARFRQEVSLTLEHPTVGRLLKEISRQTGLEFFYGEDVLSPDRPVALSAERITVATALVGILMDAGVDVLLLRGNHVALVRKRPGPAADTGAVVGRVTDKKTGAGIGGASVTIEGGRQSSTTGGDGRYRIAGIAAGTCTILARYIGYTPGSVTVSVISGQEATADFTLEKSAQRLDEVVTTGTVVPTEVKALPTPITVITAEDIQRDNLQRTDQVFRGQVAGAVAWNRDPSNDQYSTVVVRGANSLTATPTIKTLVDGVEVADPRYISMIDPNSIDRIEITRGPQASTLYGADALAGVMQIFTKKGQLGLARPEVAAKVSAGGIGGFDGRSTAFQTDNNLSILGGNEKTSYNFGGSYRHTGDWVPNFHSRDWGVSAGVQTVQGPLTLSTSARYADNTFDFPWDTRFLSYSYYSQPFYQPNAVHQQTYGLTADLQTTRTWQHVLTLGYDQTYYQNDQTQPRFTTPDDSLLRYYDVRAWKATLLYHTDLRVQLGDAVTGTVTGGVNVDSYDQTFTYTSGATRTSGNLDGQTSRLRTPWTSTGYFGQLQLSLAGRLFLTGGVRAERNPNFGVDYGAAWSPRVGGAYVFGRGAVSLKLRASYGESIRAPFPDERDSLVQFGQRQLANPSLAPERQRGADGGIEVYVGRASLAVTYYNQRAIDLIEQVPIPTAPGGLVTVQYQNVSRVKNQGWEFEGHLPLKRVQLSGTFSITNSTIRALPSTYPVGAYQVGDRVLGVPHTSGGATITYSPLSQTTLTASVTHIGHWIEHDWVSLFGYYYGAAAYRGSDRAYWIEYPAVTKVAIGVSQVIAKGLTGFARVENVGNNLRYEQYNAQIPMPRSVLVGANVRY
jgi:outer membrane receptor protein involved in Fe transport